MGMSSSQARLLSLTGRMHDIEYKAQKLEAQKLQMANESRHVYLKYEEALNSAKIQAITIGADGSAKFVDADLLVLEGNGTEQIAKSIFLKNIQNDKIYVSRTNANKYKLSDTGTVASLEEFMNNLGYTTQILGYNKISNSTPINTYSGIKTVVGTKTTREVPNLNPNWGYQAVNHAPTPADAIAVSSVTGSFDTNKTYVINRKEDLVALQTLTNSGINTQGVNFILGADIDMGNVNWIGIGNNTTNAFKGNFDGNGYTISNLTGSSGLFKYVSGNATTTKDNNNGTTVYATYGTIKNVILQNVSITSTTQETGALIGKNTGGYIDNCFSSGSIKAVNWAGGLVGHNVNGVIISSTSNANINASSCCIGGLIGHDTNGVIEHCVSTGNVYGGGGYVGGLIGHETASGSNFIYECATTSTVTGNGNKGAFIGVIDSGCAATIINSQYSSTTGLNSVGSNGGGITSDGNDSSLTAGSSRTVTTTNITLPSKQSIISNIQMAFNKSGTEFNAAFETNLNNWLSQFYKEDTNSVGGILVEDALILASINDYLTEYLESGLNTDIVDKIKTDVNNNTLTSTLNYQNNYKQTKEYEYTPYASGSTNNAVKTTTITTGTTQNVANNLFTVLKNAGYNLSTTADVTKVQNWVNTKYNSGTQAGKLALAELNNYITTSPSQSELSKIMTAINSNSAYTMQTTDKVYTEQNTTYNINLVAQTQTAEENWDTTNSDIADALDFYEIIKDGYIIVEDEQASSKSWLSNIIDMGIAIFTEYDRKTKTKLETNIATNTGLQTVSDEILLKKAEAEYEANMRRIDAKDKHYDTELATLENERNAIKTEIDTLKTVAKDNVDRTFKLFG